ncbi:MAG: hypothetical protein K5695_00765 [Oscillospiraceae bacterium]|nr:hypothetical protein [Oscillospiraceae bacterium]
MKLHFTEDPLTVFPLTTDIRDEQGAVRYTLKRDPGAIGYKLHLLHDDGTEFCLIRQKVSLLSVKFYVRMQDEGMMVVPRSNRKDGTYFDITVTGWRTFGDPRNGEFTILSEDKILAGIRKQSRAGETRCEVELREASTYEPLILAMVIAIECTLALYQSDAD